MDIKRLLKENIPPSVWKNARNIGKWAKVERKKIPPTNWFTIMTKGAYSLFPKSGSQLKLDYNKKDIWIEAFNPAGLTRANACRKEPETISWIESNMRPDDTFYDIGAHVGAYSLVARAVGGNQSKIYSFEPEPNYFSVLCKNIKANSWLENITPLNFALSNVSNAQKSTFVRLDDLVKILNLPAPNLIKIDVDGSEWEVLEGSAKTLSLPAVRTVLIEFDTNKLPEAMLVNYFADKKMLLAEKHQRRGAGVYNYIFRRHKIETDAHETKKRKMNVLGIVGARSGSKSVPNKNIRPLLGKPLMGWIIEAAKKSPYIDRLILSTDSEEYQKIGKSFGAETPFLRPAEFAKDSASDIDYLIHTVKWLEENERWKPDIILRLPPTSPLCATESINACIELLLNDPEATSARTITTAPKHPYKLWKTEGDLLVPYVPKSETGFAEPSCMPRQSYPPAYAHVDVIAIRYDTLMKDRLMTGKRTRYHLIPKENAIDIDSETDFMLAEILLEKRLKSTTQ